MPRKKTKKKEVKKSFEQQIWDAACVLWGHIPASDYRKIIIGLILLKTVSVEFEKRYQYLLENYPDEVNDPDSYISKNVFYLPEEARWSVIEQAATTPEIGKTIDNAMRAIERDNKSLEGVLPKIYASPDLDQQVLGEVVNIFSNAIGEDDFAKSKDLLGRAYEYCLQKFAEKEGKNGGEFYTPESIVKTLVAVLQPQQNQRIYDPCAGSGGMFVQSEKFIEDHAGNRDRVSIYGQESNSDTWKMAKMNMAIRGIDADFGPHHADTFRNDLHKTLKADIIMANPPFNYHPWGFKELQDDKRWKYGLPPENNANFAWIQHMISHLSPKGKIGLVLANGALSSQSSGEGEIRRKIIEDDLIEGIVALPPQMFYSTGIPATLWFISRRKKQKRKTLFIDARDLGHMIDRTHKAFSSEDIQIIVDAFENFKKGALEEKKGFSKVATIEEIKKQDYILTPGRYVGTKEADIDEEPFDAKMIRLTTELSELFLESNKLQTQIKESLLSIGYEI